MFKSGTLSPPVHAGGRGMLLTPVLYLRGNRGSPPRPPAGSNRVGSSPTQPGGLLWLWEDHGAGPPRGTTRPLITQYAGPNTVVHLRDCSHARLVRIGRNETRVLSLMFVAEVNSGTRSALGEQIGAALRELHERAALVQFQPTPGDGELQAGAVFRGVPWSPNRNGPLSFSIQIRPS